MKKESKFKVGDKAYKPKGYAFPCTIVGVFETLKGEIRVVGEMDEYGLLHIFNEGQLEHVKLITLVKNMNNERYNQIIDEVYENYKQYFENKYGNYITGTVSKEDGEYLIVNKNPLPKETILNIIYSKEEFINKCKTDTEFSEKWGLKIEERELSLEERYDLIEKDKHKQFVTWQSHGTNRIKEVIDEQGVPTKLITVTYKDERIEIYEN